MSIFALSCGLHKVTIRCPFDSTASYDLRSLYDFAIVYAFLQLFKNRKTVPVRRHVVRAPYGDPAMIVQSPHDFYDNFRDKQSCGDRKETARAQSEIEGTTHGHSTGSVRFPLKVSGYPTISVRFPYDLRTVLTQNVDASQCSPNARNRTMPVSIVNTYVIAHDHRENRRRNIIR